MYELIIIGGGPGGIAAGVYAARKKIKTLLITETFGGQSLVSADIQNWIGTKSVSGFDFAKMLEEHLRAQEDIEIVDSDVVVAVEKIDDGFRVKTKAEKAFEAKYLFIASGSRRKKLNVPGEQALDGKGVSYCSICDAPLFKGKDVAVIGGGNAGLEAVIDLFPYASKIYILEYNEALKGDPVTQEKMKANPKVEVITMAQTIEILGTDMVAGLKYKDRKTGETKELALGGVFVEVGAIPNADFVKGLVEMNEFGEIIADPKTQQTSTYGIWAAGDVSDVRHKQNNISAGDAIKAILDIDDMLHKK
ncbi:MAG: FAD-dependent oxidoreductase [Candidatus Liptonbacteria bacterium]|nr:FAD-dependent oxidoreductase [Candidatus Liptonbacteria bacterium]